MEQKQKIIPNKKSITNAFAQALYNKINPKRSLYIKASSYELFQELGDSLSSALPRPEQIQNGDKYDFIIGDLPIGMPPVEWKNTQLSIKVRIRQNWVYLLESLLHLSEDGLAIFNIEPAFLTTGEGKKLKTLLEEGGFYFQGIINAPEGVHLPLTSIRDTIILISHKCPEKLFIGELDSLESAQELAKNYYLMNDTGNLLCGALIQQSDFRSFHHFKFSKQMDVLETQYKDYESYKLGNLATSINSVKTGGKYHEIDNSVYIPCLGPSNVISNLNEATLKHQNYYQVVLDKKIVLAEYLQQYFISDLGRMVLKSLTSGSIIPRINKNDLNEVDVAVPPLQEQTMII